MTVELETRTTDQTAQLDLREALRLMLTIRLFDERALALYRAGEMRGTTHPYIGMEAVGVGRHAGAAAGRLRHQHPSRPRPHASPRAATSSMMMAELLGKATGYSGGKGGSMHIADMDKHMLGANGIVGGGMGLATGAGARPPSCSSTGAVAICFFGDGALEPGHPARGDQPGRDLEAAGGLRLREQPVRHVGPRPDWSVAGGDPARARGGVRHPRRRPSTAWTCSPSTRRPASSSSGPGAARARPIWSAPPTASTATTPAIRSTTATKEEVERWRAAATPIERVKQAAVDRAAAMPTPTRSRRSSGEVAGSRSTTRVEFAKSSPEPDARPAR